MQLIKPRWMVFSRMCKKCTHCVTAKKKIPYFVQAERYDNGNFCMRLRIGYRVLEVWRVVTIPDHGRPPIVIARA